MKQKVTTPEILPCQCGGQPKVVVAPVWQAHGYAYRVECQNKQCGKFWPRQAMTKHRAICRWNNKQNTY